MTEDNLKPPSNTPLPEVTVFKEPSPVVETTPAPEIPPVESPLPITSPTEVSAPANQPGRLKKLLPILLIILIAAAGVFGIYKLISRKGKIGKEVTLTYWGLWEPEEVMRGVIMDWEKDHPNIKINYSRQSPKEYRERLQSALARNEGPDIFRFHLTWVPMLKNELEPIPNTVINPAQFETSFYPVAGQNLRSGANYLGVPLMMDNLVLFYSEDIFAASGAKAPVTWEELRQTASSLTVKDKDGLIQTAGVALGTTANVDHWSDILGLMMLQNGADLANPAICSKQGEEEVCLGPDALTFYTLFNKTDGVWNNTLPTSTQAFAGGKLAMYFGPSWRVFDIKALNPNLKFQIAPVPQLPETNITWASFWVEGVAQKSKYKKESWEFLQYLSSAETLEKLYAAASNVRPFGEIYPRKEMADKLKTNPMVAPFIEQAPNAQTWYLCSNTYDNGLNDRMIKYFEDAVNAVNAGKTAKEALQTASQGVSQLLSQYGIGSRATQ